MTIEIIALQYTLLGACCWILWRLLIRPYIIPGPLDNIPGPPSPSFLTGVTSQLFSTQGLQYQDHLSTTYGKAFRFSGPIGTTGLFISDPLALQQIILKESQVFEYAPMTYSLNHFLFGICFVSVLDDHHKKQRKMLLPAFASQIIRQKAPALCKIAFKLRDAIMTEMGDVIAEVDMLDWMARATIECIGEGGLGYSFNVLSRDTPNRFGDAITALVPAVMAAPFWVFLARYHIYLGPLWLKRLLAKLVPDPSFQRLKRIAGTMREEAIKVMVSCKENLRLKDEQCEGTDSKLIMNILLRANMAQSEADKISDEELVSQICMLTHAATDTSTNNLAHILHLLAHYPEEQNRLHEELVNSDIDEDISYNQLMDLPFLDAVVKESLRLHPVGGIILREGRADRVLPLSTPIQGRDGKPIHEILVPRGTPVFIGVRACNQDKTLWGEDASEWKPERWLSPLPDAVKDARIPGIYSNMMSFGGGQRSCMGFQLALLETKMILAVLLRSFKFSAGTQDITWNFGNIAYPTVGKGSNELAMPLKVELWRRD